MNSTQIRIYLETKKEVDRLMLSKQVEEANPHYSYPEFLGLLVRTYKENQKR